MPEPGKVEGVDDSDLLKAASALVSIPNTREADSERFAQAIRALVERRAQSGWPGEAEGQDVVAFVMVERPREYQVRFASNPIADPIATSKPLLGNVLLLTRDGAHGQILPLPCEDANGILDWLSDEGLGSAPLIIAYRPTEVMSVRSGGVEAGLTREDKIRSVAPAATIEELRDALAHYRLNHLLTPAYCEKGVWEPKRAASYIPGKQPERAIQQGLSRALSSWFRGVVKVIDELPTNIGRIDVKLLTSVGESPPQYWAIVELKIVKSFAHATGKNKATPIDRPVNVEAIKKGLRQASAYQRNSKAEHGLLEIYDMRRDKTDDLMLDADVIAQMKKLKPKPEYAVRLMYGSPEDARLAGEAGC